MKLEKFLKAIRFSAAAQVVVTINLAVIALHVCVLAKLVPYDVIWGGRLKNENEMYAFESISIAINFLLVAVVFAKKRAIVTASSPRLATALLWIFVTLFVLNTVGNLAAESTFETLIGTPLTIVLAIMCARLAIE